MFLHFGALIFGPLIFGPLIFGPLIFGHGRPLCSATQQGPRLRWRLTATLRIIGQRRKTMNRFRLVAIATIVMFALSMVAQQTTRPGGGVPTVQGHLKVLTEKLALTADQQTKVKPILQELHDATQ